jgi:RNA polymerase sigma-70 factor (ECF subfamily)
MSGRHLVKQSGQRSFVAGVAAQYGQRLRRFLAARLRDPGEACDIAQEVYLRLLRVERHELIRNPEAYLLTIASHLLHEQALRRAAAPSVVDIESVAPELRSLCEEDPSVQADAQRRVRELESALAVLSPKARAALLLHRRDGYSIEEIGQHLGVSRAMAKKYLARALAHCRQALDAKRSQGG